MTQQLQETPNRMADLAHFGSAAHRQESRPVFFFDGDFRTQQQLEQRAQLNRAIAAYVFSGMQR